MDGAELYALTIFLRPAQNGGNCIMWFPKEDIVLFYDWFIVTGKLKSLSDD